MGKEEEDPKSRPDVNFIPLYLLEEVTKVRVGVFGSVYEGIYKPTKEKRTLKLFSSKPEVSFNTEIASSFRLKHENIIRIYGRTSIDSVNGILTEWVEGMSLKQVIHDKSISYSLSDILLWNKQSFSALEYVIQSFPGIENEHFRRYFNRIVCAESMILNPTRDILKICALGLFKDIPDPKDSSDTNYSYYWAPEVWKGKYEYEASDVYPFGVILCECIAREEPKVNLQRKSIQLYVDILYSNDDYPVSISPMFQTFLSRCTLEVCFQARFPVSVIRIILENMVPAGEGQNLDTFKRNSICFWNNEELYYCEELISFEQEDRPTVYDYHLLENLKDLASGAFGKVCSAEYEGKKIAVKFQLAMKIEPLLQEYGLLLRLKHENIVKVIGQTEKDGVFGVVMELIDGTSLAQIIYESPKSYTLGDVLKWNFQAASALEYMHSSRCLHRDIKPDNMIIENSDKRTLKVVDLGGAKRIQNSLNYTQMGTPSYMAPEVSSDDGYNEECDVYSWTISFWECLTAERPQNPPGYQSKVNQICSAKFVEVIEKCSSKNSSDRKCMFVIAKWLEDMLNNRKKFTETDEVFRENHICVWNEQTDELYHFRRTIAENTEFEKRFNDSTETNKLLVPMKRLKVFRDYAKRSTRKDKQIEIDRKLKILNFSKDGDSKYLKNEFLILSRLDHENIVKFYGYTHDYEFNYFGIITDDFLLESYSLETAIADGFYGTREVVEWSLQSARGLDYMHSQNILHCDIQPANMLTNYNLSENILKICNFKLSRDLQYEYRKEAVGTGIYMAPEVRDGLLTTKSDVYSWTVMFWELCKRQDLLPITQPGSHIKIEDFWIQMDSIDPQEGRKEPRIVNGSDKLNDFIQTCSNQDPNKRWPMTDIVELLENMMENHLTHLELESSYLPDFDNIEADKVVQENICLWSDEYLEQRIEREFFYAPVNGLLIAEP